jgi:chorismate synthase
VGTVEAQNISYDFIEQNPVRCCDPGKAKEMEELIKNIAEEGDSIGGIVELHIIGLPTGLGEPVFEKIDAELAHGLMSIGAVKGIEFGDGFNVAEQKGSENNDTFHITENKEISLKTNHSGGILGGISNGQPLVLRLAVKPPSSIKKEQTTIDQRGNEVNLSIEGRHDPCICPRVVPVAEAMAALIILDQLLSQQVLSESAGKNYQVEEKLNLTDAQLLLLLERRRKLQMELLEEKDAHKMFDTEELRDYCLQLNLNETEIIRLWEKIADLSQANEQKHPD